MIFSKKLNLTRILEILQSPKSDKEKLLRELGFKSSGGDSKKHLPTWESKRDAHRKICFPHSKSVIEEYNRFMGQNVLWFANYVIVIPNDDNERDSILKELKGEFDVIDYDSIERNIQNEEVVVDIHWINRGTPVNVIYRKGNVLVAVHGNYEGFKIYEL